ncbi:hypothetical protein LMG8520_1695 [Lactococcus lactis subsp. lactis]|uniref:Uncharacterized protein n=1 Tax=Lactococcus lactis subsp. lactis TaxID=1360 RepID=A0A0V8D3U7_LACLL|nr:hypothetical protein LMG8520_1695 [Lactococcus lactis subsp. lactis]
MIKKLRFLIFKQVIIFIISLLKKLIQKKEYLNSSKIFK